MQESYRLRERSLWILAEQKALEASKVFRHGSEEQAVALLQCALMRQQLGDVPQARAYIEDARRPFVLEQKPPGPHVQALFDNFRGWMLIEQVGGLSAARRYFDRSLPYAQEAVDPELIVANRHFRLRVASEQVLAATGAYLGAVPPDPEPRDWQVTQLRKQLAQALRDERPILLQTDKDNPHTYSSLFFAAAALGQGTAREELGPMEGLCRERDRLDVLYLINARWAISESSAEGWAQASSYANWARQLYRKLGFTRGIALAAAVEAFARLRQSWRDAIDARKCLDLWILTLLLHPYPAHPLWKTAVAQLDATWDKAKGREIRGLGGYFAELGHRIQPGEREDVFSSLDDVRAPLKPLGDLASLDPRLYRLFF